MRRLRVGVHVKIALYLRKEVVKVEIVGAEDSRSGNLERSVNLEWSKKEYTPKSLLLIIYA